MFSFSLTNPGPLHLRKIHRENSQTHTDHTLPPLTNTKTLNLLFQLSPGDAEGALSAMSPSEVLRANDKQTNKHTHTHTQTDMCTEHLVGCPQSALRADGAALGLHSRILYKSIRLCVLNSLFFTTYIQSATVWREIPKVRFSREQRQY